MSHTQGQMASITFITNGKRTVVKALYDHDDTNWLCRLLLLATLSQCLPTVSSAFVTTTVSTSPTVLSIPLLTSQALLCGYGRNPLIALLTSGEGGTTPLPLCSSIASGTLLFASVRKDFTLLNGAADMKLTLNVSASVIQTNVATFAYTGVDATSFITAVVNETEIVTSSILEASGAQQVPLTPSPTPPSPQSYVGSFTDRDGNEWSIFPGAHIMLHFSKVDSKARFTMHHAATKAYYPVSEYSYSVPAAIGASLCAGGGAVKCCLDAGGASYTVFTLVSAYDPVTCTTNASIEFLDQLSVIEGQHYVTNGRTTSYVGMNTSGQFRQILNADSFASLSSLVSNVAVTGSSPTLTSSSLQYNQLCRNGGFLSNVGQSEPFFVPDYNFGLSSRQIGYNVTQYVRDRQCNGAPLGYYTAADGNNSDQLSAWRTRSVSYFLTPLIWRNELLTSISPSLTTFAEYFSMTIKSSSSITVSQEFNIPIASILRPNNIALVLISPSIDGITSIAANSSSAVVRLSVSVYPLQQWLLPSPNLIMTVPRANVRCLCAYRDTTTLLPNATTSYLNMSFPLFATTLKSSSFNAALMIRRVVWNVTVPVYHPALTSAAPQDSLTCAWTLEQLDMNTTSLSAAASSGEAPLMHNTATTSIPSVASLVTQFARVAIQIALLPNSTSAAFLQSDAMSLHSVVQQRVVMVPNPNNMDRSLSTAIQCQGDTLFDAWLNACESPNVVAATLALTAPSSIVLYSEETRYNKLCDQWYGGGRSFYLDALQRCVPNPIASIPISSRSSNDAVATLDVLNSSQGLLSRIVTYVTFAAYYSSASFETAISKAESSATGMLVGNIELPPWIAIPSTTSLPPTFTMRFVRPSPSGSSYSFQWLSGVMVAAVKLPFTPKAVIGLILVLLCGMLCVIVMYLIGFRWRNMLPWREDIAWGRNRVAACIARLLTALTGCGQHLKRCAAHINERFTKAIAELKKRRAERACSRTTTKLAGGSEHSHRAISVPWYRRLLNVAQLRRTGGNSNKDHREGGGSESSRRSSKRGRNREKHISATLSSPSPKSNRSSRTCAVAISETSREPFDERSHQHSTNNKGNVLRGPVVNRSEVVPCSAPMQQQVGVYSASTRRLERKCSTHCLPTTSERSNDNTDERRCESSGNVRTVQQAVLPQRGPLAKEMEAVTEKVLG